VSFYIVFTAKIHKNKQGHTYIPELGEDTLWQLIIDKYEAEPNKTQSQIARDLCC
jgi:hypothetical protein